jgi:hypothetical protein
MACDIASHAEKFFNPIFIPIFQVNPNKIAPELREFEAPRQPSSHAGYRSAARPVFQSLTY